MEENEKWSPALMQAENEDITTWELPEGAIKRLGQGIIMGNLIPSPNRKHFVVPSSIGVWWYDVSTMTPVALWDTDRGFISAASFSPNGKWLATGDGDGLVKVWDVQQGVCISQIERDKEEKRYHSVSRLVFSPDSQRLVVSSTRDYILIVYHPETGEQLAKFHDDPKKTRWWGGTPRPIAFSADGSLLACTMPDESMRMHADRRGYIRLPKDATEFIAVWCLETGQQLACLTDTGRLVRSLCFSLCGRFLASGGRDGTVQVWSVANWELLHTYQDYGTERKKVFYSPEGVLYAAEISNDDFTVWNIHTGEKSNTYLETHQGLQGTHSPKECPFVSATSSEFKVWTVGISQPLTYPHLHYDFYLYSHIKAPNNFVFLPDNHTLAGGYMEDGVLLWDVANPMHPPTRFNPPEDIRNISISSHGTLQAIGMDKKIAKVWEVENSDVPITSFTLPDPENPATDQEKQVTAAAFAHKRNLLACGDNEGMLYLWDVQQREILHTLTAHDGEIHSIIFSPNEKLLVSVKDAGPISRMWDVESGEPIEAFPGKYRAIVFSDCSTLVACGNIQKLLLWDTLQRKIMMSLPLPQESWDPFTLAFSPCGRYLASGAWWNQGLGIKKCPVLLWDVESGENIAAFRGHPTDIQSLAFSPDSTLLASGGFDGTILLWDLKPYIDS